MRPEILDLKQKIPFNLENISQDLSSFKCEYKLSFMTISKIQAVLVARLDSDNEDIIAHIDVGGVEWGALLVELTKYDALSSLSYLAHVTIG